MDKTSIHERIGELERELADVKLAAGLATTAAKRVSWRRFSRLVVSHWVLISFVAGLLVAVYVKVAFGIEFLDSYRQQATQRKIAEIHRQLGDRLMAYSEWSAAAHSYRRAIAADANNEKATQGLLLSTVYEPLEGQRFVVDDVVNARLRFAAEAFGENSRVCFLRAIQHLYWGELDEAERQCRRSIDLDPQFPGAYLTLGYLLQGAYDTPSRKWRVDLARAAENFAKAVALDPQNGQALNNLGYCSFLQRDFKVATDHFERSNAFAPSLLTALNLGDAQRMLGHFQDALATHRIAFGRAMAPEMEGERYVGGEWKFNFVPLGDEDAARVESLVIVGELPTKRALAAFHLSFDHALLGDTEGAQSWYAEWATPAALRDLGPLMINRIDLILQLPDVGPKIQEWFAEKKAQFQR